MTSYLIILNPVSGRGRGRERGERLAEVLRVAATVDVVETDARGSATRLAAEGADDVDRVIAVGGDGTLNEVAMGLRSLGRPAAELPELGFLASGTANAATRAFRLEADPEALARALPSASSRPVDLGVVRSDAGERPFLLWCGAGYDAVIIDELNTSRSGPMGISGLIVNAPRVAARIAGYREPPVRLVVDGQAWPGRSGFIVANVAEIAFGGTLVEAADPFDGRLDVVAAPEGTKWRLPFFGAAMLRSGLQDVGAVRVGQATRIAADSEADVPFQLDGEPAGTLPVEIRIEPGAIRMLGVEAAG